MYVDANNVYGWAMSEKLPVDKFTWETDWSVFTSDFIKNHDSHSDLEYIFYVDIIYPKELYELHKDLPFLPDRMGVNKVNKLVASVHDKTNYVIHIYALKQAWNYGLILKKVHAVISFNHAAWLKPYIDMNTENTIWIYEHQLRMLSKKITLN